jgi:hypothetical protein
MDDVLLAAFETPPSWLKPASRKRSSARQPTGAGAALARRR